MGEKSPEFVQDTGQMIKTQADDGQMSGGEVGGRKSDPAQFVSGNYGRGVQKGGRGSYEGKHRRRWGSYFVTTEEGWVVFILSLLFILCIYLFLSRLC